MFTSLLVGISVPSNQQHSVDVINEIRLDIFVKLCLWDVDWVTRRRATRVVLGCWGLFDLKAKSEHEYDQNP